jgi:hypothetical protein
MNFNLELALKHYIHYRQIKKNVARLGHETSEELTQALINFTQYVEAFTDPNRVLLEWDRNFDEAETRHLHQGG